VVGNGAMKYLRDLSDHHGSRLTGTPGYDDAAKWAKQKLDAAGIEVTRMEPFTVAHGWQRGAVTARVVIPADRALHVESTGWSPPTNGPLRAEIVVMKDATPEKIKADAARLKGKIVLMVSDTPRRHETKGKRPRLMEPLRDAGIAALLVAHSRADNILTAHSAHVGNDLGGAFPTFDLGKEDGLALERLSEEGPVTLELSNASTLSGPTDVVNVVGEIRGVGNPEQWILVCAHLDAWDYATGSQDNGAGVATVLEVARALKASGYVPRRSIRFVLWSGEEEGLLGSRAYVSSHAAEMAAIALVINTDNGAGPLKGWHTEGRDDVKAAMKEFSKQRLGGLGAGALDDEATCDTDHCPFMIAGVPTLNLWVDMKAYFEVHHASSDTFDKIDAGQLSNATATVALTTIEAADRDAPLGPHLDHAAVGTLLKKADLLDELVEEGVWKK
jgi:carboxypeptidase Q